MRHAWRHGMTDYQDYRYDKQGRKRDEDIANPGAYIAEYIGKDGAQFGRAELQDKKRYTTSRGIKRPRKVVLDAGLVGGDIETMTYKGKQYRNTYYNLTAIPGTQLFGVSAHYKEVRT